MTNFAIGLKNAEYQTNSSGTYSAHRFYDGFGNLLSGGGSFKFPFGYGGPFGYQEDSDTGLKLLGHRYYDSGTGRFLTRDPVKDGRNWYGYCGGSPVNNYDPTGLIYLSLSYGGMIILVSPGIYAEVGLGFDTDTGNLSGYGQIGGGVGAGVLLSTGPAAGIGQGAPQQGWSGGVTVAGGGGNGGGVAGHVDVDLSNTDKPGVGASGGGKVGPGVTGGAGVIFGGYGTFSLPIANIYLSLAAVEGFFDRMGDIVTWTGQEIERKIAEYVEYLMSPLWD